MLQGYVYTIPSAAQVDIIYANNSTFQDAMQFGLATDTWTLTGQSFVMDIKASRDDATPLITLTSASGQIVIDDAINRVIHFNVPDTVMSAALQVGKYVYDLIMEDTSTPPIRIPLMQGHFYVGQGVTES